MLTNRRPSIAISDLNKEVAVLWRRRSVFWLPYHQVGWKYGMRHDGNSSGLTQPVLLLSLGRVTL